MTFEKLQDKIEEKYKETGLFPFISKHCKGTGEDIEKIETNIFELVSFDDVSKKPGSDLEEYYIKELLNIHSQNEVNIFIKKFRDLKEKVKDEENKIIIGSGKYSKATVFKVNIEKDFCFDKSKIKIEDYNIVTRDLRSNLGNIGNANIRSFALVIR